MGGGSWTSSAFETYSRSVGRSVDRSTGAVTTDYVTVQEAYKKSGIDPSMDPRNSKNFVRECCENAEHPNTLPIILALDVTGSMGHTAIEVSKKLNIIVTNAIQSCPDAEFMVMGIGDVECDSDPIQYSQFEADVRIAQCLDTIYFEGHGGGNAYESYTAAWLIGSRRTKCDCWNRGKRGLIITIGDEPINPVLECNDLHRALGESITQADIRTSDLYKEVLPKYAVRHVVINHHYGRDEYYAGCAKSFANVIGAENVVISSVDKVAEDIGRLIRDFSESEHDGVSANSAEGPGGLRVEKSDDGSMGVIFWA